MSPLLIPDELEALNSALFLHINKHSQASPWRGKDVVPAKERRLVLYDLGT